MPRALPAGTVTFLFTDVEGSTQLLHELGAERYAEVLAEHRRIVREAFTRHGGVEVDTQGDAFFVAFASAAAAVAAALAAQTALACGPIRVRMGLHTGAPLLVDGGYVGEDVHKGARIAAVGYGGQVLLSPETRELVDTEVTALGEHRLKDFRQPVSIYQLGSERFPPLRTISNTNLPRPASSFVGRGREVAELSALLRDGARLLTLTGPGGSGKTRLAIEVAAELVPAFKGGVFWVGLAPVRDPALVMETVAQTLGAKDGLAEYIGERELLLLLDNVEQVIETAPELASLVERCPHLRLLVTSRELLRVRGEVEYPALPLPEREAVDLFCARARVEPDESVGALCRALDYLPLALELAAARANVLSPAQMIEILAERLDVFKGGRDADPRQQTLRATIAWSYELLSQDEQQLFARLAVFAGGCTLETAEEIAGADLDTLQSLVDKNLVGHTGERFWMLETIREYASERLAETDEADLSRERHAGHFLALAEEAEPQLRGTPGEWLERLEHELDNLRAAAEQLESSGDGERALRLAAALWKFWNMRGYLAEGARQVERALAADGRPTTTRADALAGAAALAVGIGDVKMAKLRAEEALALHGRLRNDWGVAYAVLLLGLVATEESDFEAARRLMDESAQRFRDVGDEHYTLMAMDNLAWISSQLGDLGGARVLHEGVVRGARLTGNERMEALSLGGLAAITTEEGRPDEAVAMLSASLPIWHRLGDRHMVARELLRFARALAAERRAERAALLLSCSEALHEEIAAREAWRPAEVERTLAMIRAHLDEAAVAAAWEQGRKLTIEEAVALALESAVTG